MNTSNDSSVSSPEIIGITSISINLVLGIPINGWVMWLVLTGAAGTTMASEIFTFNLSVCEILFCLLSSLYYIKEELKSVHQFNHGFFLTGRPLFQSCMCIERFMAVIHPVLFLKYKPLRYRLACSVVAWLIIIGVSLLYMGLNISGHSRAYYVVLGESLVFMSVMLLCSLAILRALKQAGPGEASRERDNTVKRRAFFIVCLIMVSFLGTYFAWCVVLFFYGIQDVFEEDQAVLARYICMAITLISGLFQPLLYICQKTGKLPCFKPQGA